MKKWIFLLILISCGWWFYTDKYGTPSKEDSKNQKKEDSKVLKLKKEKFTKSITTNGGIVPIRVVEIKCRASGEIIKLPFDVSDIVEKGDLLVELDPVEEQRRVKQAEIRLTESQANLTNSKLLLEKSKIELKTSKKVLKNQIEITQAKYDDLKRKMARQNALFKKKLISEEEFENTQTTCKISMHELELSRIKLEQLDSDEMEITRKEQDVIRANSQYEEALIALQMAKQNYEYTKVYSPINGVISERNVQVGQIISSGINNIGGGTTIMNLCDLSRIYGVCSVDESDIGSVKLKQKAKITVDSYEKEVFWGAVERIAIAGKNVSNVVTFDVRIEVTSDNKGLLKPEMTVNAEIISDEIEDAIVVPDDYIDHSGKKPVVKTFSKGKVNGVTVELGISDGYNTVIINGLKEKDRVVPIDFKKEENGKRSGFDRRSARMSMRAAGGGGRGR